MKVIILAALGLASLGADLEAFAASNKDRVGLGARKGEEQPPQATETKQYCTAVNSKVQAGKAKEQTQDDSAAQVCQSAPATRPSDETRAEIRKIERNPNN